MSRAVLLLASVAALCLLQDGPLWVAAEQQPTPTPSKKALVCQGADLPAALADSSVATIELTTDIRLEESHWDGLTGRLPLVLDRNVTIRSAESAGYAVLIDFNYITGKIQLMPGYELHVDNVVTANFRSSPIRATPGLDIFVKSPLPVPDQLRPILRRTGGGVLYRLCWGADLQIKAPMPARPPEVPGEQQAVVPPQGPLQAGCDNASPSAMRRCWQLRTHTVDAAFLAMEPDAVGQPTPSNYVIHQLDVYSMCETLVPDECVKTAQTPLACWSLAWSALNNGSAPQPQLILRNWTFVGQGAELPAALADRSIAAVELTGNIQLQQSHWDGLAGGLPLVLDRNVTVRSSVCVGYAAVIDFNYLAGKMQLMPGVVLRFEDIVTANVRSTPIRATPGLDIFVKSPLPAPDQLRPILRRVGGAVMYRVCWGAAVQLSVPFPARPPEVPGEQQASVPPLEPLQRGCDNSSASAMARCWQLRTLSTDIAFDAMEPSPVGQPTRSNFVIHQLGVYGLCETVVPDECVKELGALPCWQLSWDALHNGSSRPPPAAAPPPPGPAGHVAAGVGGAAGAGGAEQPPEAAGGGGDSDVPVEVVVPVVVGGTLLVALLAAVVFLHVRRKRRAAAAAQPPDGKQLGKAPDAEIETGIKPAADATTDSDAVKGPQAQATDSTLNASTSATDADKAPLPASQRPAVPLTKRTPLGSHVRLDLRWGVDVVVFQDALRGAGAFGRVLEGAYQGQRVAVKVLHVRGGAGAVPQKAINSLTNEVQLLGKCSHPNIVAVLGACLMLPKLCVVMELMDQSLEQLMCSVPCRLLPMQKVLQVASDMMHGLAYLHPTVTHRDLKPANVLLDEAGNAKLSDFGLARLRETVAQTQHPEAGTIPYMPPECFDPTNNIITHKADIYSWAVVVWEMLDGGRPWDKMAPLVVAFAVTYEKKRLPLQQLPPERRPRKLQQLLVECWDQDPQRRPSAEEVLKRLALVRQDMERDASRCLAMHLGGTTEDSSARAAAMAATPPSYPGAATQSLVTEEGVLGGPASDEPQGPSSAQLQQERADRSARQSDAGEGEAATSASEQTQVELALPPLQLAGEPQEPTPPQAQRRAAPTQPADAVAVQGQAVSQAPGASTFYSATSGPGTGLDLSVDALHRCG